jgi:hypothetical protein
MEIPPDSSFAQSTAYFTGYSENEITKRILGIQPFSGPNFLTANSNLSVALSSTGTSNDFKTADYQEAYRMMNGQQLYPFQSIAQISNHKFDPYYFDGSENEPNFNVVENLIGTPLGASVMDDPRLSYVRNLLTLREYQGQSDQLNDKYLKELYMINAEKGSTYYQNMLERQQQAMSDWTRSGRATKGGPLDPIHFTVNLPGVSEHKKSRKRSMTQTMFSTTPSVQRSYQRSQWERAPAIRDENDSVSMRTVVSRGTLSSSTDIDDESKISSTSGSLSRISSGSISRISSGSNRSRHTNDTLSLGYSESQEDLNSIPSLTESETTPERTNTSISFSRRPTPGGKSRFLSLSRPNPESETMQSVITTPAITAPPGTPFNASQSVNLETPITDAESLVENRFTDPWTQQINTITPGTGESFPLQNSIASLAQGSPLTRGNIVSADMNTSAFSQNSILRNWTRPSEETKTPEIPLKTGRGSKRESMNTTFDSSGSDQSRSGDSVMSFIAGPRGDYNEQLDYFHRHGDESLRSAVDYVRNFRTIGTPAYEEYVQRTLHIERPYIPQWSSGDTVLSDHWENFRQNLRNKSATQEGRAEISRYFSSRRR